MVSWWWDVGGGMLVVGWRGGWGYKMGGGSWGWGPFWLCLTVTNGIDYRG